MLEDTRNEEQAESFAFAIESIVERERERETGRAHSHASQVPGFFLWFFLR
jgi:hypothetical protein